MLSIIITHHQTPALLKLCLKSIRDNIGDIEHEIIIAESESRVKDQQEIQEVFGEVNFISFEENLGYAKLVNSGLRQTKGEYILILNADIIVLKGAIKEMLQFIEEHPLVGMVGPQLLTFANKVQPSCFHFPTLGAILARRTFLGKLKWGRKKIKGFVIKPMLEVGTPTFMAVDWLQGSAFLVRKSAVEKAGLLDERFFMYLEDADWCRRFWQNGFEVVYLADAQMAHYYYRSSQRLGGLLDLFFNKYARMHLVSAAKYFWKWRGNKIKNEK